MTLRGLVAALQLIGRVGSATEGPGLAADPAALALQQLSAPFLAAAATAAAATAGGAAEPRLLVALVASLPALHRQHFGAYPAALSAQGAVLPTHAVLLAALQSLSTAGVAVMPQPPDLAVCAAAAASCGCVPPESWLELLRSEVRSQIFLVSACQGAVVLASLESLASRLAASGEAEAAERASAADGTKAGASSDGPRRGSGLQGETPATATAVTADWLLPPDWAAMLWDEVRGKAAAAAADLPSCADALLELAWYAEAGLLPAPDPRAGGGAGGGGWRRTRGGTAAPAGAELLGVERVRYLCSALSAQLGPQLDSCNGAQLALVLPAAARLAAYGTAVPSGQGSSAAVPDPEAADASSAGLAHAAAAAVLRQAVADVLVAAAQRQEQYEAQQQGQRIAVWGQRTDPVAIAAMSSGLKQLLMLANAETPPGDPSSAAAVGTAATPLLAYLSGRSFAGAVPADLAAMLQGLADMLLRPDDTWVGAFCDATMPLIRDSATSLADLGGLAHGAACAWVVPTEEWHAALQAETLARLQQRTAAGADPGEGGAAQRGAHVALEQLLWAQTLWYRLCSPSDAGSGSGGPGGWLNGGGRRLRPSGAWLDAVLAACVPLLPGARPQVLSGMAYSLNRLGHDPGPDFIAALLHGCGTSLSAFDGPQLSRLAYGLAGLGYQPEDSWVATLQEQAAMKLGQCRSHELADLLEGVLLLAEGSETDLAGGGTASAVAATKGTAAQVGVAGREKLLMSCSDSRVSLSFLDAMWRATGAHLEVEGIIMSEALTRRALRSELDIVQRCKAEFRARVADPRVGPFWRYWTEQIPALDPNLTAPGEDVKAQLAELAETAFDPDDWGKEPMAHLRSFLVWSVLRDGAMPQPGPEGLPPWAGLLAARCQPEEGVALALTLQRLGHRPGREWARLLLREVLQPALATGALPAQVVAALLASLAAMRLRPPDSWLDDALAVLQDRQSELPVPARADLLDTLAALEVRPTPEWLSPLVDAFWASLPQLLPARAQQGHPAASSDAMDKLVSGLAALSSLDVSVKQGQLRSLLELLARRLEAAAVTAGPDPGAATPTAAASGAAAEVARVLICLADMRRATPDRANRRSLDLLFRAVAERLPLSGPLTPKLLDSWDKLVPM
ncbi:hypothetical protein GPECTOR_38g288 [Gonium pectorale]|uniref:Uncharacterized protein n=1 Tax=Gonium pectorale TaxID=33097 RepID=A0A150GB20_GONPE|nr:hypothetical protein GPECTOR_38g288 [Gonium pectorale]|eukprot:KXZ47051.1 hypothetical protein GPECTOR_38g288 [Gonium pectorale]